MHQRLKIKLHEVHNKTGFTPYMVGKLTGVNKSTVAKYVSNGDVIMEKLENAVFVLAKFYGVDWRDPAIVEVIEVDDADEA